MNNTTVIPVQVKRPTTCAECGNRILTGWIVYDGLCGICADRKQLRFDWSAFDGFPASRKKDEEVQP